MIHARVLFLAARVARRLGLRPLSGRIERRASVAWVTALKGKAWVEARR